MTMRSRWLEANNLLGISLIEILMIVSLLGLVIMGAQNFFTVTQAGFSLNETHNTLKTAAQRTVNQIERKVVQSKRIFDSTPLSDAFRSRIQLPAGTVVLAGSTLHQIEINGVLSPSSTYFISTSVGSRLFFASLAEARSVTALNASSSSQTLRIDLFNFHYYFLSSNSAQTI